MRRRRGREGENVRARQRKARRNGECLVTTLVRSLFVVAAARHMVVVASICRASICRASICRASICRAGPATQTNAAQR